MNGQWATHVTRSATIASSAEGGFVVFTVLPLFARPVEDRYSCVKSRLNHGQRPLPACIRSVSNDAPLKRRSLLSNVYGAILMSALVDYGFRSRLSQCIPLTSYDGLDQCDVAVTFLRLLRRGSPRA